VAGNTKSTLPRIAPPATGIVFVKALATQEVRLVSDHIILPGEEITDAEPMIVLVFVLPVKETEIVTPFVLIKEGP
jgi:hypothetical protein